MSTHTPTPLDVIHKALARISIDEDRPRRMAESLMSIRQWLWDNDKGVEAYCNSHEALVAAVKELQKVRYPGASCPWCGQSQGDKHFTLCPTFAADAALKAAKEES